MAPLLRQEATATIPIVTPALADAVHLGLIASEARPGGNVTGISPYVAGLPAKQLELAREVVPGAGSIGVLANLTDAKAPAQLQELKGAGLELGVKVVAAEADTPDDVDDAIRTLASQRIGVMIVLQTSMLLSERRKIAALVSTEQIPTVYGYREHVDAGGLISYGVDLRACFRRGAYFVDKILHGIAPGDLPVRVPNEAGVGDQSQSCEGARPHYPIFSPRPRRRGDRIDITLLHFAAAHQIPQLALLRHPDRHGECPSSRAKRKTYARTEFFSV